VPRVVVVTGADVVPVLLLDELTVTEVPGVVSVVVMLWLVSDGGVDSVVSVVLVVVSVVSVVVVSVVLVVVSVDSVVLVVVSVDSVVLVVVSGQVYSLSQLGDVSVVSEVESTVDSVDSVVPDGSDGSDGSVVGTVVVSQVGYGLP